MPPHEEGKRKISFPNSNVSGGNIVVVLIENGKSPDQPYNARLEFWLPPDSPYGNFQLKLRKLCERLDEANRRLIDTFDYWNQAMEQKTSVNLFQRHEYAIEQAVYLMRRVADELIAMIWCLHEWEKTGDYPRQIRIDCIGAALESTQQNLSKDLKVLFDPHNPVMKALNEISNAFKHSFVHSDLTLIGRDEPCVYALGLADNKLSSEMKFHNFSVSWLVREFSAFYKSGMQWLASFSERHRK